MILVLVIWPVVQMLMCSYYRFSSWRFAGWGMYATPHAYNHQIKIHFFADRNFPTHIDFVRRTKYDRQLPDVYIAAGDSMTKIDLEVLSDEQADRIKSIVRSVKMFQKPGSLQLLLKRLREWHPDLVNAENAVVWIARPRVDLMRQITYAEMDIFLYENGHLTKIGVFNTARDDISDFDMPDR
jgi:hypothetical protein